MTPFGKAMRRAYKLGVHDALADWCVHTGVSHDVVRGWINGETEPAWLRTLRTIKRRTGLSWGELLDGRERATARRVTTYRDEGRVTGRATCSECGGAVGQHDKYCKHCGCRLVSDREGER